MEERFFNFRKTPDNRERNAYRIAAILLVVLAVFDIFSTLNYFGQKSTQLLFAMLLSYAATIATLVCVWLLRQSRVNAAVWGMIIITLISLLLSQLLGNGLGTIYGITAIAVTAMIAGQGLESRQIVPANIGGVAFGTAIILLDFFNPSNNSTKTNVGVTFFILFMLLLALALVVASQFRNYTIRAKLIVLFLIMSIIPLITITTHNTIQMEQTLINGAETSLQSNAEQTANSMDTFIQTTLDSIIIEAQFIDFTSYLTLSPSAPPIAQARALDLLNKLRDKSNRYIISYALVDTDGIVLLDTLEVNIKNDESREAYFKQVKFSNEPIVSVVTYWKDKTPSITFASKIININGDNLGILRVKYNSAVLQDVLTTSVGASTDATVLLLDPLNIRMADNQNPELIQKSIVPLETTDYLLAVDSHRFLNIPREEQATNYLDLELALNEAVNQPFFRVDITPEIQGDDTVAVAFLQTQPWTVVYSRPTSVFLADVQKQIRTNIILVLGISIIISIITTLIARSLTNPITALAKVANSIEQGDLSARAKIESRDEIGVLAGSFNLMTNQLQETLNNLEERVTERTDIAEIARAEAENAAAEAQAARNDLEMQIWLSTGQTQLADAIRGAQDISQLADNVISQTCRYIGAQTGALFLLDKNILTLAGRYAFTERPGFNGQFQLGEGLVGQAALDGKVLRLENITPDTSIISTGLVGITPRQMAAAPFYANGEVVGVIELATLSVFTKNHLDLWEHNSENIGVAFRAMQTRQRLSELLMESQQQAEELQAQEEELRSANEELRAQAENLKAARELRAQKDQA